MRGMGLFGVAAGRKKPRTTVPDASGQRPADPAGAGLHCANAQPPLGRRYHVCGHGLRVCVHGVAFVTDLFSRKIVGWQVADHLRAGLALDALEMAIFARQDGIGDELVHHSDRGVQDGFKGSSQQWR